MRDWNGVRVGFLGMAAAVVIACGLQGRVSVRDFAKRKTVIVRAGKKCVASAKKK